MADKTGGVPQLSEIKKDFKVNFKAKPPNVHNVMKCSMKRSEIQDDT